MTPRATAVALTVAAGCAAAARLAEVSVAGCLRSLRSCMGRVSQGARPNPEADCEPLPTFDFALDATE